MEENQIQPQPYWADFKIKVGLYVNQNEGGETKRVLIDPKDIQFKFTYKDSKDNQLVGSPYASELTEEDLKIAINKNWVINR